jgi:hypothetical protein
MLILTQLFCNTSEERALIKDEETQVTCQKYQRDFMRIINGHQNENTEKAFGPHFIIHGFPSCEYIHKYYAVTSKQQTTKCFGNLHWQPARTIQFWWTLKGEIEYSEALIVELTT